MSEEPNKTHLVRVRAEIVEMERLDGNDDGITQGGGGPADVNVRPDDGPASLREREDFKNDPEEEDDAIFECVDLPMVALSKIRSAEAGDDGAGSSAGPSNVATTGGKYVTKSAGHTPPQSVELNIKKRPQKFSRNQCRFCNDYYADEENRRGSCKVSHDCFQTCVENATCMNVVRGVNYHCLQDPDDDSPMHPCDCAPRDQSCLKRWLVLCLMILISPCLCFYYPLRAVYRIARCCGLTGSIHQPIYQMLGAQQPGPEQRDPELGVPEDTSD